MFSVQLPSRQITNLLLRMSFIISNPKLVHFMKFADSGLHNKGKIINLEYSRISLLALVSNEIKVKRPRVIRAGIASGRIQKVNQETITMRKAGI